MYVKVKSPYLIQIMLPIQLCLLWVVPIQNQKMMILLKNSPCDKHVENK